MSVTKLAGLVVSDSLGGAESVSRAAQETLSPVRLSVRPLMRLVYMWALEALVVILDAMVCCCGHIFIVTASSGGGKVVVLILFCHVRVQSVNFWHGSYYISMIAASTLKLCQNNNKLSRV